MRQLTLIIIGLLSFVAMGCLRQDQGLTLSFTEAEIHEKLARKFPKTEKIYDVIPVIIEQPTVHFVEGQDRVGLGLRARVDIPFQGSYSAGLKFSTGILFDEEEKALQLTEITVEGIEASKLPEKYEPALKILGTVLARKYLEELEVYRLKEKDLKDKTVRYLLKDARIKDGKLVVTLGL